jgi:glycosyltransferase involved in cell wall biosynthesis
MEIIHLVLGKVNPNRLNGVNKVVYQMATEQTNAGKNVSVWGITKELNHDYPERNFTTVLFKSSRNPFGIVKELKDAIVTHKAAVFHLHGGWIPVYSSLSRWFAKHQIKFVLTPHGAYNSVAMQRSSFTKKLYFKLFERTLLRNAYRIHSIGQSEVEGLDSIFPNDKSFLLPYGFEMPVVNKEVVKSNQFIIGFVGRIDVYTKGLDVLLEAVFQFQKTHKDVALWIVGDGEEMSFLKTFIAEHSMNNVVLYGKKFGDEKNDLIQAMTVFAHPSRNEGLPTSVLEAASFGVPSIVTEATNVASYIDKYKAGMSIETTSADQLLVALKEMYDSKDFDYAPNCIEMLNNEFAWSVLVQEYDKLYA